MALLRTAARSIGCQSCHQWVLKSFITSIGGLPATQPLPQRRHLSRPARRLNEARERLQVEEQHVLNEINELDTVEVQDVAKDEPLSERANQDSGLESLENVAGLKSTAPTEPSTAGEVTHIPWYLQQSSETPAAESPFAARQRLPDLPEHPPALLQPLLQHVSVELGMDSLSLLDLRQLDPPPALGANLLMIVGTARSEKHLHVSADRLCRWLRTEYKMTPFADGLLGRNELKLKMKRKAKRARLMSAVGAKSADGELDDGLRTGWVCVNLGRVEGGELPEELGKVQRAEGVVGFGAKTTGSNIVVQLMTEDKRGELDLEKLWMGIMNRARRGKATEEAEDTKGEAADGEDVTDMVAEQPPAPDGSRTYHPSQHTPRAIAGQQARAYHTTARCMTETTPATLNASTLLPAYRAARMKRNLISNDSPAL